MDLCTIKCINEKEVNKTAENLPCKEDIIDMAAIFKALGDPSRLKILLCLRHQEHCVCDISAICGQTESAVSHQLRILRSLKIVKNRREGKIVYYSLDDDHVSSLLETSLAHVRH
ncbi:MAG: helix-turn-helix transcriptional regulator [Desulfobacter sp.]|nr:helix-turn-helix transcriptional regulator [Desulfobacter sp.]WDP87747.1 MAG: helix-turn-helix transcriptional regulator [Desulfobacter sp.]